MVSIPKREPSALASDPELNVDFAPKDSNRSPALSVFVSFSLGILLDFYFHPDLFDWMILGGLTTISWIISYRIQRNSLSTVILLLLVVCLGGMRHHKFWFCHPPHHITRVLKNDNQQDPNAKIVRVMGTVCTKPQTEIPADEEQFDPDQPTQRTNLILDCRELISDAAKIPVTGKVYVTISDPVHQMKRDQLPLLSVGDLIEVCGELKQFSSQQNPHDFDIQTYFRQQQIGAVLRVKSSHAANIVSKRDAISWFSLRHYFHNRFAQQIKKHTSEQTQAIGLALLLGDRSELSSATRKKFSQTGLIHFLAISGLHIGFFALFVWGICHVLNLPRSISVSLLICAILFYLSIIEIRPPILRAASFCVLVTLGLINWRAITTLNLVCLSALIILVINPTDLFDVGAQLSFLAVSAILWTVQQEFYQNPFQQSWVPLRWRFLASNPSLQSPLQWFSIRYFRLLYSIFLVTAFIWIVTAPLVLYHFKLIAPIGLLINTLIFPFLFLILLLGYLLIFVGSLIPFSGNLFGACFDYSVQLLLWIVECASSIPFSHLELPAPPLWWLIVYYSLFVFIILPIQVNLKLGWNYLFHKLRVSIIPIWIIVGLLVSLCVPESTSFRCTFIAVNHGISILLELPDGKTILYDAGSMSPVEQTYSKIKNTLLDHRIRRIDLLLISHADRDHFNAATKLISNQYIRELAFPQAFLSQNQKGPLILCDTAIQHDVPVKIIGKGDQIAFDSGVKLEVLHPRFSEIYEDDNPASLTILITFKGRQILLTGDLEGEGLNQLLSEPITAPLDVLLSPHHGSLSANTTELARWANPRYLIISGGKKQTATHLEKVYASNTNIFSTTSEGAITCLINDAGKLKITPFRSRE
ncbi:ComEC/Rec2 family competence protein [Gimesia aquarii]|uniref:ComEC family competence protein n=1 Tax=Gimesia aquarii TaxID=2527964 RepID=A0A517VWU1_9PLAN|nr:ComEC/Rec2 family competence protein [Gimesia aquarii]QDT97452.1 ComEC family competence protein [Gimesia aquarii]